MSDHAKDERAPDENQPAEAQTERTEGTVDGDYEALVRLLKENEELKDRALRAAAEMENLRRRTARDVHDARSYAIANFARDMLSVSDNLRRALDAIPAEVKASGDAGFKALIEGVEITERAMLSALERHGVKKLQPEGEKFDPNFHQAMFEVPNPGGSGEHGGAGRAARLLDRRARAAPGHGRRRQGRPEVVPATCRRNPARSTARPRRTPDLSGFAPFVYA